MGKEARLSADSKRVRYIQANLVNHLKIFERFGDELFGDRRL
jgi:hypothetical protein